MAKTSNKNCLICEKNLDIDYKDVDLLRRFITPQAKIASRRRTGACAKHQRRLKKAIKRAREIGFLPYTTRTIDTRQL